MSLVNDYHMYYEGTFISFEENGIKVPFYVTEVRWVGRCPSDEWNLDNVNQIKFRGYRLEKIERGSNTRYSFNDDQVWKDYDDLIFEVPELGYFEVPGLDRPLWLATLPQRSAKKGFTLRKSNRGRNLDRDVQNMVVWETYNSTKTYAERNIALDGRNIDYKGIRIGQYDTEENGTRVIRGINPNAEYIRPLIEELFNANNI